MTFNFLTTFEYPDVIGEREVTKIGIESSGISDDRRYKIRFPLYPVLSIVDRSWQYLCKVRVRRVISCHVRYGSDVVSAR